MKTTFKIIITYKKMKIKINIVFLIINSRKIKNKIYKFDKYRIKRNMIKNIKYTIMKNNINYQINQKKIKY